LKILDIQSNSDLASELGPLKYLSELTKIPMNKIVNYLLLVIVFVFDPLAISLVIAANFAFKVARTKKIGNVDDVFEKEIKTENMDDDEKNIDTSTESFIYSFDEFENPSTFPNNVQYRKEPKPIYDMEELGMMQQESVELPEEEINQMSTEAGKLEYRKESERFIPTEEFLERLQGELNKIEQKKTQLEKEEKTNSTETDLEKLEKYLQIIKSKETIIDKPEKTITLKKKQPEVIEENENIEDMDVTLMDGLEEEQIFEEKDEFLGTDTTYEEEKKQENEDPNPQPKQRLTYQKRDGGRNITVSRF
jgi:hypothetical protein